MPMSDSKPYVIKSIERAGDIKVFRLFPEDGKPIAFLPGQFVNLFKLDEKTLTRAYSVASPPEWPYIELAIQIIGGKFTSYVDTLNVNDKIGLMGPFGANSYLGETKVVMIAGGIGITPMMGIIRHIAANRIKGDFRLYYFCGRMEGAPYVSELVSYHSAGIIKADLRFTRDTCAPFGTGRIDINKVMESLGPSFAEYSFYLCGPVAMVKSFSDAIVARGVDKKKIKSDAFG
jgi:ferredoxin-NADP reductase